MTLLPRSLYGRLALLLVAVVALAAVSLFVVFRQDRAALVARQFSEAKVAQLAAMRDALEAAGADARRDTLNRIGREHGARIADEADHPRLAAPGPPLRWPLLVELEARLKDRLGPGTELRPQPNRGVLWIRLEAAGRGYWAGLPMPPPRPPEAMPTRAIAWSIGIVLVLLAIAFAFARYLARPLRELHAAVDALGRGETPAPLPEQGPSEIAAVNRRFNAMLASLAQAERDRAVLLAGVSHDLRTPLARLRLGVEMSAEPAARPGMVADIEEMDRIVGQFLDFARDPADARREEVDLDDLVAGAVERYSSAGREVRFLPGGAGRRRVAPTAITRVVANLVDNALAYGAPPVEVATSVDGARVAIEVRDRGPGVRTDDVERLKRPFTRANDARARADGAAGAGLGLAIVERIARMHGGTLDLLPREGGGTVARVTLPAGTAPGTVPGIG